MFCQIGFTWVSSKINGFIGFIYSIQNLNWIIQHDWIVLLILLLQKKQQQQQQQQNDRVEVAYILKVRLPVTLSLYHRRQKIAAEDPSN